MFDLVGMTYLKGFQLVSLLLRITPLFEVDLIRRRQCPVILPVGNFLE